MNLQRSKTSFERCRRRGTVLIIVLWIAIGLVSIALYFANSMTYELRASDNRTSGLVSDQAIEGAARYINYVLSNYATNGAVPLSTQFSCQAVPVGDAHFWLIGRDNSSTPPTEPAFGLVDEASKLNVNYANTNELYYLPNMTLDLAEAIVDWRSTNDVGNFSMDYSSSGYEDKHAAFETVDELHLVYGMTMGILYGNDLNRNGVLDTSEQTNGAITEVQPGLSEYLTVYTREPNFDIDGNSFTNVSNASATGLRTLFQNYDVSNARQIAGRLSPTTGPGAGGTTYPGMLAFCLACKNDGMSSADFAKIYPYISTSAASYIRGRVNINTASETVLEALFMGLGIDQSTAESAAQTMVTYREQNPSNTNSPAWMIDALGSTSQVLRTVAGGGDYITTHSYQFTADIAAVGPYGRGYRRVKFIFDTSDGTPKIIYRQDLSGLGWALGDKARETWVVNANANISND
jgi:type II secretory pathway component PulK